VDVAAPSIPGPFTDAQLAEWEDVAAGGVLPRNNSSKAFGTSLVVKAGQGKLYGASLYNQNAAARHVLLFDAATLPANGAPAAATFPIAAAAATGIYFGSVGRAFEQGILFALSTTAGTLTIAGSDLWVDAQFL
jgi:hypothetical protein